MPITLNDDGTEDYERQNCPHDIKLQPGIDITYESEDADGAAVATMRANMMSSRLSFFFSVPITAARTRLA